MLYSSSGLMSVGGIVLSKLSTWAALSLVFVAAESNAGIITATFTGTVTEVTGKSFGYQAGDHFSGSMRVNGDLLDFFAFSDAPGDERCPESSNYGASSQTDFCSFESTDRKAVRSELLGFNDQLENSLAVTIVDDEPYLPDGYYVGDAFDGIEPLGDYFSIRNGDRALSIFDPSRDSIGEVLSDFLSITGGDFINQVGFEQNFTLLASEFSGEMAYGATNRLTKFTSTGIETLSLDSFQVALNRVTVSVPEPGSLGMFGVGLLGLGAMRRRRAARAF